MASFLVCKFDKSTLSNLVKECFGQNFPDIFHKQQIEYIYQYLSELSAKTALLEREYIDKDYLEDYSRYYVKCFNNGGHKCARLHFFSTEIDHGQLNEILSGEGGSWRADFLQAAYLGFVVVKPLPKTFIGKTCLKQYKRVRDGVAGRKCLSKVYQIDLFGLSLKVESIAFQEQDKVVSACATTSIWSALHAIAWRNSREIPACSEITINAINHIDGSNNSFPNKELSNKQILRALDVEGLRHHAESLDGEAYGNFFDFVRISIDSGLPLILGVDVFVFEQERRLRSLAGHAVTVLGYKPTEQDGGIYIHDDRTGPFARAAHIDLSAFEFARFSATIDSDPPKWGLVLQRKDEGGEWQEGHEVLVPRSLIIPTYRKVRLSSTLARNTCRAMLEEYDSCLNEIGAKHGNDAVLPYKDVRFSLRLAEISQIRQSIIGYDFDSSCQNLLLLRAKKVEFLTGSYARFQWMAQFFLQGEPAFRMFFDATDIPQGDVVSGVFIEHDLRADAILGLLKKYAEEAKGVFPPSSDSFFGAVLNFLMPKPSGYSAHLDRTYGDLRAPKYLKVDEFSGGVVNENDSVQKLYEPVELSLESVFPDLVEDNPRSYMIWAVAHDGALLIGREVGDKGHPTLTGFKPARIAGELSRRSGLWVINSKSGRYSKDYAEEAEYLSNALKKFKSIFFVSRDKIVTDGHFSEERLSAIDSSLH